MSETMTEVSSIKGRPLRALRVTRDAIDSSWFTWFVEAVDGGAFWMSGGWPSEESAVLEYKGWLQKMNDDPAVPEWENEAVDKSGRLNPKVIVRDCVAACPDLERAPIVDIVTAVIESSGATLQEIEKEIEEAGGSTPNVCAVLMGVGAVFEVARQLPGTRGQLVEAGRVVGRATSSRYAAKIKAKISEAQGGN